MKAKLGDAQYAYKWLTDEKWVVFEVESIKFLAYLEYNYFTPGTRRNAEFEVAVIPIEHKGCIGMTFWFRFKNSAFNRQVFVDAMESYYRKPLPKNWEKTTSIIQARIRSTLRVEVKRGGTVLTYNGDIGNNKELMEG